MLAVASERVLHSLSLVSLQLTHPSFAAHPPQCLDEDWYPDVRLAAAVVEGALLDAIGSALSDEQRRAVYTELLKRLDDSNNQVRLMLEAARQSARRFSTRGSAGILPDVLMGRS